MATAINNHHLMKQITGPVSSGAAITPDDANDLQYETRGIYVGAQGDLKVTLAQDGSTVTFTALAAGVSTPLRQGVSWRRARPATDVLALF